MVNIIPLDDTRERIIVSRKEGTEEVELSEVVEEPTYPGAGWWLKVKAVVSAAGGPITSILSNVKKIVSADRSKHRNLSTWTKIFAEDTVTKDLDLITKTTDGSHMRLDVDAKISSGQVNVEVDTHTVSNERGGNDSVSADNNAQNSLNTGGGTATDQKTLTAIRSDIDSISLANRAKVWALATASKMFGKETTTGILRVLNMLPSPDYNVVSTNKPLFVKQVEEPRNKSFMTDIIVRAGDELYVDFTELDKLGTEAIGFSIETDNKVTVRFEPEADNKGSRAIDADEGIEFAKGECKITKLHLTNTVEGRFPDHEGYMYRYNYGYKYGYCDMYDYYNADACVKIIAIGYKPQDG